MFISTFSDNQTSFPYHFPRLGTPSIIRWQYVNHCNETNDELQTHFNHGLSWRDIWCAVSRVWSTWLSIGCSGGRAEAADSVRVEEGHHIGIFTINESPVAMVYFTWFPCRAVRLERSINKVTIFCDSNNLLSPRTNCLVNITLNLLSISATLVIFKAHLSKSLYLWRVGPILINAWAVWMIMICTCCVKSCTKAVVELNGFLLKLGTWSEHILSWCARCPGKYRNTTQCDSYYLVCNSLRFQEIINWANFLVLLSISSTNSLIQCCTARDWHWSDVSPRWSESHLKVYLVLSWYWRTVLHFEAVIRVWICLDSDESHPEIFTTSDAQLSSPLTLIVLILHVHALIHTIALVNLVRNGWKIKSLTRGWRNKASIWE